MTMSNRWKVRPVSSFLFGITLCRLVYSLNDRLDHMFVFHGTLVFPLPQGFARIELRASLMLEQVTIKLV
jgi:hypothetical protein